MYKCSYKLKYSSVVFIYMHRGSTFMFVELKSIHSWIYLLNIEIHINACKRVNQHIYHTTQYQARWMAQNVTKKLCLSSHNSHSRMRYTHVKTNYRMRYKQKTNTHNISR